MVQCCSTHDHTEDDMERKEIGLGREGTSEETSGDLGDDNMTVNMVFELPAEF
jgi:hypothetical protein